MKSLLSGDASQITQVLAPQISAEKTAAQQTNKTNAMMGNRGGGTAASTAATNDKVHSDITNLIGGLTGSAASGLTSAGTSLLGAGISGTSAAFGEANQMQQQRANQWNDIFKSAASVAGGVIGGLPAGAGSWQDITSNALAG
jgi:hypothetical protein